jgi:hypothetical protein
MTTGSPVAEMEQRAAELRVTGGDTVQDFGKDRRDDEKGVRVVGGRR